MNNVNLDSFTDFAGDFIKAAYVDEPQAVLVCVGVEYQQQSGKNKLILNVEYSQRKWKFSLNMTNLSFVSSKVSSPKELIGKKISVDKIPANNPVTHEIVDALRIIKIE
jgi:hypothetical protein